MSVIVLFSVKKRKNLNKKVILYPRKLNTLQKYLINPSFIKKDKAMVLDRKVHQRVK